MRNFPLREKRLLVHREAPVERERIVVLPVVEGISGGRRESCGSASSRLYLPSLILLFRFYKWSNQIREDLDVARV